MTETDLSALDEWFGRVLGGLSPGKRRRAAMKLGQALRRSNLKRQQQNIEPDGSAMEPRKARLDRRGRIRRKAGGKMFRKLRYARNWRIDARPDSVEVLPKNGAKVAAVHHFGLKGYVGRGPDGKKVFTRYPRRQVLGFGKEDREAALDIAAELFDEAP